MKKLRPRFSRLVVVLLLSGAAASARAADESTGAGEIMGVPVKVPGQLSTLFKINDADPESTVPTPQQRIGNPLEFGYYVQDLLAKAEAAAKRHDPQLVIKYYRALAAAISEQAQGWSLLCEAYVAAGEKAHALVACKYAIEREGATFNDYRRFVDLLATKDGELSSDERGVLQQVLAHLDGQPELRIETAHLRCQAAVKTKDATALENCTAVLAKTAPDDPKTIVFQWTLAVMRGDRDGAARLLERAEQAGVASENIERMSRVAGSWSRRVVGTAVACGAVIILAMLFLIVTRRRLAAARRLAP